MPAVRRHHPRPTRIRALEMLAQRGADGCTEAVMLAHGFTAQQIAALISAGLVTGLRERVNTGVRRLEVTRLQITEAGRKALARTKT